MDLRLRRLLGRALTGALLSAAAMPAVFLMPHAQAAELGFSSVQAQQEPDGTVHVDWTLGGSGPEVTGFRVTRVEGSSEVVVARPDASASSALDPLNELTRGGHLVSYAVTATGKHGDLVTGTAFPPTIYKGVPSGPAAVDITTNGATVMLAWEQPAINVPLLTGYRVERRLAPSGPWSTIESGSLSRSKVDTVPGLEPGVHDIEYRITSLGALANGGDQDFNVLVYVEVPSAPESVAARMAFDGGEGVVTWGAPATNPGLVTGYLLTRSLGGGHDERIATLGADATRYVDQTLRKAENGTMARYTLAALVGDRPGEGASGGLAVEHTPLKAEPAPDVRPREHSLVVRWNAPPGAGSVAAYEVRYRAEGTGSWSMVPADQINETDLSARVTDLRDGVRYEVQVAAVDVPDAGMGEWSASGFAVAEPRPEPSESGSRGPRPSPSRSANPGQQPTAAAPSGPAGSAPGGVLAETGIGDPFTVSAVGLGSVAAGSVLGLCLMRRKRRPRI